MASSKTEPLLARELRAAGHDTIADKHAATQELHGRLAPDADGHRPLSDEELAVQADNALTAEELQHVQAVEYGTYAANGDIHHGTALAYAAGHPVPVSAVERYGYEEMGLVRRIAPQPEPAAKAEPEPSGKAAAKAKTETPADTK
jgi:hypothetical protein